MTSALENKSAYVMEDPREAQRLTDKVEPASWVANYLVPLGLDGCRILDVGCGPAVIAAEIGKQIPQATIVALDQSESRLESAKLNIADLSNVTLERGDAMNLPFCDNTFDFVMCRFLLEYLPDKELALREFSRVLKTNGRVFLQDLDGQLLWHYPTDESLLRDIESTLKVLGKTGFDPFVGRKLFHLCFQSGFQNLKVQIEPYHVIIGRIDSFSRSLWELKLDIASPASGTALGGMEAADDLKRRFLAFLDREDSLTYSVLFSVVGTNA